MPFSQKGFTVCVQWHPKPWFHLSHFRNLVCSGSCVSGALPIAPLCSVPSKGVFILECHLDTAGPFSLLVASFPRGASPKSRWNTGTRVCTAISLNYFLSIFCEFPNIFQIEQEICFMKQFTSIWVFSYYNLLECL